MQDTEDLRALERLLNGAMSSAKSNFCLTRLRLLSKAIVALIRFLGEERKLLPVDAVELVEVTGFDDFA